MAKKLRRKDPRPVAGGRVESPDKLRKKVRGKKFILTSAQNNTYVHEGFLNALEAYAKHHEAKILVSTFTYNKEGFQNGFKDSKKLWYDPRIVQYIRNDSIILAAGLVFCGELNILPTAVNPLSGLENYCRNLSGIVPHAKVAMLSLPRMPTTTPRFMYTTGTITQRNYIPQKAGQKADFHHVFGAILVEIDDDGEWYARHLIADRNGIFQDLREVWFPDGKHINSRVEAINWGDIHIEKSDDLVLENCFGKGGILDVLKPNFQFIHDLSDFTARNHHNRKNAFFLADQRFNGIDAVEQGIRQAARFLEKIRRAFVQTVVVESNHDLALRRWLEEADGHRDPVNARYWHYLNYHMFRAIELNNADINIFKLALEEHGNVADIKFLRENDSFIICQDSGGIECALHGHNGPNGSRGNPKNLRSVGLRINTGHTHSAGIIDGCYTAGVTGSLDQGYNVGPTSWSHSHIITYPNGKRAIITIKENGKWKA